MRLPRVVARETGPGSLRLTLAVDPDLDWFAGHFPGQPVLPGIAQIGWAIAFAREGFGLAADPPGLDQVKFLRPVEPGATLVLELKYNEGLRRVRYRLTNGEDTVGSGRLDFGSGETP
ncbi:MAG TPA: hypothetical protein VFX38_03190 [Gammaproteobacteria bacterium]|nr:hypothetical protein [Gammaproteobacteria bacterium]